ncbi:MAG TPA: DinB family protein [Planctomycetota bacterium]|nr:DinB family protein [Planctomycetota bacterium]
MAIRDAIMPEFEHEMMNTRKTLERIPDGKFGYKPHEKSFTMGRLASHIVEIPGWLGGILKQDSLDIAPAGGPAYTPPSLNTTKELLAAFDKNVETGRGVIGSTEDAEFFKPWSLLKTGKALMTMPKIAVVRSFVISHVIHHRAQLGVYLRMNNIAVPSIYGPSADEGQF